MPGPFFFAWVGGPAIAPFELLTSGDLWGGSVSTVARVWGGQLSTRGDVAANSSIITNLTDIDGLVVGQNYLITGNGIATSADGFSRDTYFTYTGGTSGTLSGSSSGALQPGPVVAGFQTFVLLPLPSGSGPAMASGAGVSLILSSSIGTNVVLLRSTKGLKSGVVYGIAGGGIPAGATFPYAGNALVTISAPATSTGQNVSVRISSTLNRAILSNLASEAGLQSGVTYNLFGRGLPNGTTGIAIDATSMALSANATVTGIGVQVLISRAASFPDGGAFDPNVHAREDENVFALEIGHAEGNFPSAVVDIQNPRVGLLGSARKPWVWISWNNGSQIVPLFHGRLVGVPAELQGELIRLNFIARSENFVAQKAALATTLRVLPYWDPVWLLEKATDPDTVLEARTQLWHIDRLTLQVSVSDILAGEDGTLVLDESQHLYDHLSLSFAQAPLRRVNVTGTVTWSQEAEGDVDLTEALWEAFAAAGSAQGFPVITSFTGDGLKTSWPAARTSIGGGWSVGELATISDAAWVRKAEYAVRYEDKAPTAKAQQIPTSPGSSGTIAIPSSAAMVTAGYQVYDLLVGLSAFRINFPVHYSAARSRSEVVAFSLEADTQSILTEAGSAEEETIDLSSAFVSQPVELDGSLPIGDLRRNSYFPTDRGVQSFEFLLLLARAKLISRSRAVQIKFVTTWANAASLSCRWNVSLTDRRIPGQTAIGKVTEYKLIATGAGDFSAEVTIHCAIGHGGVAAGVPLALVPSALVAVGGLAVAVDGTPCYVGGYFAPGVCQQQLGGQSLLQIGGQPQSQVGVQPLVGGQPKLGDIVYENLDNLSVIDDDGVDLTNLTNGTIILNLGVEGGQAEQKAAIDGVPTLLTPGMTPAPVGLPSLGALTPAIKGLTTSLGNQGVGIGALPAITTTQLAQHPFTPVEALQLNPTRVTLELVPVTGGAFQSSFYVLTSKLQLLKTIDLEAA